MNPQATQTSAEKWGGCEICAPLHNLRFTIKVSIYGQWVHIDGQN